MRNCNKVITVRLTDEEFSHCELMAKGNKSFYVRQLIQKDINCTDTLTKDTIIKIIEEYLAREKPLEQSMEQPPSSAQLEQTKTAKQVIATMFNF